MLEQNNSVKKRAHIIDDNSNTQPLIDEQQPETLSSSDPQQNTSSNLSVVSVLMMAQVACLLYICLQGLVKDLQLTHGMSVVEITFLRTCTTLVGACALIAIFKKNPFTEVSRKDLAPLLFRSLSGSCAFIVVTKAVRYLPLTIFQTMANLTPFMSGILACIFLGERLAPI